MGGRDHTEQCPKCGVWCGGLDNAPCACDVITVEREAAQHARQEATWRDECMRLRAELARLQAERP